MRYLKVAVVVSLALCAWSDDIVGEEKTIRLNVLLDQDATLFLHMECLAGGYSCSSAPYVSFWRSALGADRFDRMVSSWSSIMDPYDVSAPHRGSGANPEYPDIGPEPGFSLRWLVQQAMISNNPIQDRKEILDFLMRREDARSLFQIMSDHREPFDTWWRDHEAEWWKLRDEISAMANDSTLRLTRNLFGFFGLNFSNGLSVVMLPRPDGPASYRGSQRGEVAIIEVGENDSPEAKVGVLLHELTHRLIIEASAFNARRYAAAEELNVPGIGVAVGLSNEVLATVIGNGIAQKSLRSASEFSEYKRTPRSLYDDNAVDAAAKATLSLVEEALKSAALPEKQFFQEFYIEVVQSLGDLVYQPQVALQTSNFLYTDEAFESFALSAWRDLSLASMYTNHWVADKSETFVASKFPQVSTVLLASAVDIRLILQKLGGSTKMPSALKEPCVIVNEHGGLVFLVPINGTRPTEPFPKQFEICDKSGSRS